ncbi:hypothetical protein HBI23_256880 [Parastagonospora nodorum]|nr:hypothetical protein HBI23_256880 [Parastagonospora nodorum]KAH5982911.1 hypothetical protein HBI84_249940 [Parastagonospora nodorum]KAH6515411.1 hypothetical protein HBI07_251440 [Parastagonospora nodorum]
MMRRDKDNHASNSKDDRNHRDVSCALAGTSFTNAVDMGISAVLEALSDIGGESKRWLAGECIKISAAVSRPDYHAQPVRSTHPS